MMICFFETMNQSSLIPTVSDVFALNAFLGTKNRWSSSVPGLHPVEAN